MAFTQVGHLIAASMRKLRLLSSGDYPNTSEYADYVDALNLMRRQWSAKRYVNPTLELDALAIGSGVSSRTIGPTGNLVTARPIKIISAFLRDSVSLLDSRFKVIGNRLEYDGIGDKAAIGKPSQIFYNATYPNGILYFDRVTDAAYTLYLQSQKQIGDYVDQNALLTDPPEYHEVYMYNLCIRIADENSQALLTPAIVAVAKEGLRDLRRLRASEQNEDLEMPSGLSYGGGYSMNDFIAGL